VLKLYAVVMFLSPVWIRHCSHARLPAFDATLQFGQSGCSTLSVLPMRLLGGAGLELALLSCSLEDIR